MNKASFHANKVGHRAFLRFDKDNELDDMLGMEDGKKLCFYLNIDIDDIYKNVTNKVNKIKTLFYI